MKLNKHQLQLFEDLTQLNGVAGQENEVAKYLKKAYLSLGCEILTDNLGSIIALKKSKNPNAKRVFVVGHMDEVGFMVLQVLSNGLIKANPIGGHNSETLLSSRVLLKTKKGDYLKGAIVALPPHLMKNAGNEKTKIADMLFDFGFTSKEEAFAAGVYIGAMMVIEGKMEVLHNEERILTKAVDDRYGLVIGLEMLEALKDIELDYDLYVGGSVQEEVGCRGGQTSAYLVDPDLAIVVDCSPARDTSGDTSALGQLGEGVLIRFMDGNMIAFPELLDFQVECAKEANVKYQYFDSPGGTDAGNIHKLRDGVLTLTHCICARSIHTNSTIFDANDYLSARDSLLVILKKLNTKVIDDLKGVRK